MTKVLRDSTDRAGPEERQRVSFPELRQALESALSENQKSSVRIATLHRRISIYSSSYTIENLVVELENGNHLELVLKDLSPASVLKAARQIRPGFLYRPLRELETYREILHRPRLGTAVCYGSVQVPTEERFWLFLERVRGPLLWQLEKGAAWSDAARWLARLHSAFPDGPELRKHPGVTHALIIGKEYLEIWPERAEEFVRHRMLATTPETRARFSRLMDRYDVVVKRLLGQPTSFIHGEYYPSNIIVQDNPEDRRICAVDWEMAGIGPSFLDLATLTSGDWSESDRRVMIEAYGTAMHELGAPSLAISDMLEAVDLCQLHLSVQMLGWSSNWQPPERHTQNWFEGALRLADRLGIN